MESLFRLAFLTQHAKNKYLLLWLCSANMTARLTVPLEGLKMAELDCLSSQNVIYDVCVCPLEST